MSKFVLWFGMFFLGFPVISLATWQVGDPFQGDRVNRIADPTLGRSDFPSGYVSNSDYIIHVDKGWLKSNIIRIAKDYGWKVIWRAPENYLVLRHSEIAGANFEEVITRLIQHYPLRIIFDKSRCVLYISPKKGHFYLK